MEMKTDETHEERKAKKQTTQCSEMKWDCSANAAPATQIQVQSLH